VLTTATGTPVASGTPLQPLDRALLAELADVVSTATRAFDGYDYTAALEAAERFFWTFCDDYVELVKARAYGEFGEPGAASAAETLRLALSSLLRLFAPFLPFVTEEVWSWWQDGSVHRATWPSADALHERAGDVDPQIMGIARDAIAAVRKAKTEAKVSMRTEVANVTATGTPDDLSRLATIADDLRGAGRINDLQQAEGGTGALVLTVTL
jgi:valyl-tRNA synthetase